MTKIALPPAADTVDGLITPSAADARTYVGWRVDGFLYQWEKARGIERWLAFWLASRAMIETFFLVFLYAMFLGSSRRRYYMNAERSAILGVAVRRGRWRIIDQAVSHPGTGSGRALHDLLQPMLLAEADQQGIVVEVFAASTFLAERYKEQLPGIEIIRRTFLRGLLLRREPRGDEVTGPARTLPMDAPQPRK